MIEHWLGLITGICFGVLLQQGRVLRFEKQVGAMLLKDMTIMKFMMSAILVGMVGVHLAAAYGLAQLGPKATQIGANVVGGLLFGLGWAVMGFCPGIEVGGDRDLAGIGVLGIADIVPLLSEGAITTCRWWTSSSAWWAW